MEEVRNMSNYVFVYRGGQRSGSPEEGAKQRAKWQAWVSSLGAAMINPGTPLGKSKTVSSTGVSDGGGPNPVMGYSIVAANSMDAALKMAKACPFLEMGTIVVAEAMEMM
jgi:hypothetical protein